MRSPRIAAAAAAGVVAVLAACGFDDEGTGDDAGAPGDEGGATFDSPGTMKPPGDAPLDVVFGPPVDFVPSHVSSSVKFDDKAANLDGQRIIDTGGNGSVMPALPSGARIENHDNIIVLFVKDWNVSAPISVIGDKPLVVLASGLVAVTAKIDAGANGTMRGPGGASPGQGSGAGGKGADIGANVQTGGGGASFGGLGAPGGGGALPNRGAAGALYGDKFSDFFGGSGGGEGSHQGCSGYGEGGAGGGAIQISAKVGVSIGPGAWINAGGGGGQGGCQDKDGQAQSGGGGGSGGTIVLEGPTLAIQGVLAANGGGGGGGGGGSLNGSRYNGLPGGSAGVGLPNVGVAPGGMPPAGATISEGSGGAGAIEGVAAISPSPSNTKQGGGGGGVGRIWLRAISGGAIVTGITSPTWQRAP